MDEKTDYEKLIESINQLSSVVATYYKALIEQGLDETTARVLSAEYQKSILSLGNKQ